MRAGLCIVFLVLGVGSAVGQTIVYRGGFERAINRYRWNAALDAMHQVGPWRMTFREQYQSDAFLLFDDRLTFRDVNAVRVSGERDLGSGGTRMVFSGRSDWFSLSRVLSQSAYAGISLPLSGLRVTPLAGVAMDRRPGLRLADGMVPIRSDGGPALGLQLELENRDVGGYRLEATGQGFREFMDPRRGGITRFAGSAERAFESTVLRADVDLGSARRDAYQAASFLNREDGGDRLSETVESTRSDTLGGSVGLTTPITRSLELTGSVGFNLNRRRVRTLRAPEDALYFDSDFNRRTADAEAGLVYAAQGRQIRVGLQGGAEIERRNLVNEASLPPTQAAQKRDLLSQADYDRGYVTAQIAARTPLLGRFVLMGDFSANAIRHDTPIINPDDRDEVYYNGRVGLLYRPSQALETEVQLFGTYYHTVYLKAARSAENNVQRGLRLRPSVRWRPSSRTRISLNSEVRATYTVDDFVLPGRRPTDQAARELRFDLSLDHDLGHDLRVMGEARTSDLRLGRFLDKVFAEIPIDTLRTYGGWLRLQAGSRVMAEVGLRLFIRTDFDRAASVRYPRTDADGNPVVDERGTTLYSTISRPGRERIAQVGPTCAVTWPLRGGELRFDGWYTVQRVSRKLYGDLPEASAGVIRKTGARGERTIIPNLSLTVRWDL